MEPKIRLKGFSGEWEKKTLSQILTISNEQNKKNNFSKEDVFSVSDEFGVVNQIKHLGRSYAGKSLTGYKVLRENQIVYTKSPLRQKPYGIIKVNESGVGIVSVLYGIYNVSDEMHPKFIDRYFEPGYRTNNYLLPLINKGAKNTINISDQTAIAGEIILPHDKKEQIAICNYLDSIDSLIQSTTKKIESLKQVKAASLQSMFPQEGETTPRVRFKGFEGEWEKVSLKKYAKRINRKNKNMESTLALTISSIDGLVSQIDYFNNLVVGANLTNYYLLKNGEFAYNKSYSRGYPFGSVKRLDRYDQGILSTLYIVFSINDEISSDYLARFFDTTLWHKQVAERAEEGARNHGLLNIGADDFMTIDIVVPKSLAEQQKIADYFTNLDSQITLQTQRLEKLRQIKSACLDNMLV